MNALINPPHKCELCGSITAISNNKLFDTRFGIPNTYSIARCPNCSLEKTVPIPTPEEIKSLYETFYNFGGEKNTFYTRLRGLFLSSWIYRFWMVLDGDMSFHAKRGKGRLLDIGCNEGRGLAIYQRNGYSAEGLELNEAAAEVARSHGFMVYTTPFEIFQPKYLYDVVILSNVLEHSLDPRSMIFQVHRLLKSGGEVWISCPNSQSWLRSLFGQYWINWHVPFHITHFSTGTLKRLLRSVGFTPLRVQQYTPSLWVAHSVIARLFAKPGRTTRQLRNPILIILLMLTIRGLLFPILWLGNLLGKGDCLIVAARKD